MSEYQPRHTDAFYEAVGDSIIEKVKSRYPLCSDDAVLEFAKLFLPEDELEEVEQIYATDPLRFKRLLAKMSFGRLDLVPKIFELMDEAYQSLLDGKDN